MTTEKEEKVECFQVKSISPYFEKERSGDKPNTIRDKEDWNDKKWLDYQLATHITITNPDTFECFTRKISDKTSFGAFAIISWNPNEEALSQKDREIEELKEKIEKIRKIAEKQKGCYSCSVDSDILELLNKPKEPKVK